MDLGTAGRICSMTEVKGSVSDAGVPQPARPLLGAEPCRAAGSAGRWERRPSPSALG